jgi:hypothetical protein
LVTAGLINPGQGTALTTHLRNALKKLGRSRCDLAIIQLRAFIRLVSVFNAGGIITAASAQSLINDANNNISFIDKNR